MRWSRPKSLSIVGSALVAGCVAAAVAAAAGCGGSSSSTDKTTTGTQTTTSGVKGSVAVVGVWTGDEEASFRAVLAGFKKRYPSVAVSYKSAGDNTPTVLATAVAGGNPPALAAVSQPGLVVDFQRKGALKRLDFVKPTLQANYPSDIAKIGQIDGHIYGLLIKGANKSTVWYNVAAFRNAGVQPPKTWEAFLQAAKTLRASGVPAYSIGGADGWTLTDLFENIYLRQAGPSKYDQLSRHEIKWTDPSVKAALKTMAAVIGDTPNIAQGRAGALQTDFPTSVANVFTANPKAAQVIEGDFVPGVVASTTTLKPVAGYNVFGFPSINGSQGYVEGGGDELMMFKDTPAARALVTYLATGEAQSIWARRGGYTAPAKTVPASAYPDEITRTTATAVCHANVFRFDLSDLQPASFGATVGQGEFKLFQDFLRNPNNINGTAAALERSAAKAYSKSG
jgi:alpha-glucoside transport system substrate-binding protein